MAHVVFRGPPCSKCLLDLAVLQLVDQGVMSRHGYGNWALYTVRSKR
jgi:hypothetical protein